MCESIILFPLWDGQNDESLWHSSWHRTTAPDGLAAHFVWNWMGAPVLQPVIVSPPSHDHMESEETVSISAVGAAAYICCTITFILLVCLLFFLGLTPTQRWHISYVFLSLMSNVFVISRLDDIETLKFLLLIPIVPYQLWLVYTRILKIWSYRSKI